MKNLKKFIQNIQPLQKPTNCNSNNKIGRELCKNAEIQNQYTFWRTFHPTSYGAVGRDLYIGASGIGLFLLDLYNVTHKDIYLKHAERSALWLKESNPRIGKDPLPGLYFGESGVGLYFLRLYRTIGNQKYIEWAISQSKLVSHIPHKSQDRKCIKQ